MKLSALRSLASASLLLALMATAGLPSRAAFARDGMGAATRPRYGGTLRIATRDVTASIDPVQATAGSAVKLCGLVFDTLIVLDSNANPQPALARAWQAGSDQRRWQFPLRAEVKLHPGPPGRADLARTGVDDGSVLTPPQVAASLVAANPGWRVSAVGDTVILEFDAPRPHLLAELARPKNAIVVRSGEQLLGTGPYRLTDWQPGRRAVLSANDDYWGGRPFLDAVEVTMGRGFRDQLMDLDLGKADVIEIAPDQVRRAMQDGRRIETSAPVDLIALQFSRGRSATENIHLRQALGLAIDRSAINNVLLQRQGEPAGGLLPQWLSGYAFLFPSATDLPQARELRPLSYAQLTLGCDPGDSLARVVAERVAVNARDAGLLIQVASNGSSANADARIVRLRLDSGDPAAALAGLAAVLDPAQLAQISGAASPEALYSAERALVDEFQVLPLVHIPEFYALGTRVRDWDEPRVGGWPLSTVWVEPTTGSPSRAGFTRDGAEGPAKEQP